MSRPSSPAPGMSSGTVIASRTDRFQPCRRPAARPAPPLPAWSGTACPTCAPRRCRPAPWRAAPRPPGGRTRSAGRPRYAAASPAPPRSGNRRSRAGLPVLLAQPGPGELAVVPAAQMLAAGPDPQQRGAERPRRRGLDLLELLPCVGGLGGGRACRDPPRRRGGGSCRMPGTFGSHWRVISRQVRPYTVAGRDSRHPAQTAGVMSSAAAGAGSRAAAYRRNSRITLYPLLQVAAARHGWSGPASRANPAAHPASSGRGPGRTLKSKTASVPPDSPGTVTVRASGSS